jgi:hypothetical protein
LCEYYEGFCVDKCGNYTDGTECTDALNGSCFWILEDGGDGFCVVRNNVVCSDLLNENQCNGDDVPSSLTDVCFFLKGNNSESSSQRQNMCIDKVWNIKRGENK